MRVIEIIIIMDNNNDSNIYNRNNDDSDNEAKIVINLMKIRFNELYIYTNKECCSGLFVCINKVIKYYIFFDFYFLIKINYILFCDEIKEGLI